MSTPHAEIRVCETCQGFAYVCKECRGYHLVDEGQGGEYSMPPWLSESWLKKRGGVAENFGDIPIPFVRVPPDYESALYDLAIY